MDGPGQWAAPRPRWSACPGRDPDTIQYTVTLEPHHMRWLFAIDLPDRVPAGAKLTTDYQLLNDAAGARTPALRDELAARELSMAEESPAALRRALRLPSASNPTRPGAWPGDPRTVGNRPGGQSTTC